jgi:integrase
MVAARRTPMTPSHRARNRKKTRGRAPGDRYLMSSYGHAIARGCDLAFPHPELSRIKGRELTAEQRTELKAWRRANRWHPHQLRHNAATLLRKEFGLDVARVILGHSSPAVTEVYAEVDRAKAVEVMAQIG